MCGALPHSLQDVVHMLAAHRMPAEGCLQGAQHNCSAVAAVSLIAESAPHMHADLQTCGQLAVLWLDCSGSALATLLLKSCNQGSRNTCPLQHQHAPAA